MPLPFKLPIGSETEGSTYLTRPKPGPRVTEISWRSVPWNESQVASFLGFAQRTLRDGSLAFQMPVFKPAEGYVTRYCQIKKGAVSLDESNAPLFVVSFTLVVYNW